MTSLLRQPKVKQTARACTRAVGRLTSGLRVTPDFLIIGGQRCGTTSLFRTLAQHPAVLTPILNKGVHYFDTAYPRGMGWYRAHFPLHATARRVERRTGVKPLTFESSPYYGFHPLAADRIERDLPGVKVLVLLRDPVERAYSAHAHELARGFETEESFERALELEEERLAGAEEVLRADPRASHHAHRHLAYLARGRYADQLERLEPLFGRERILVIDSHRFFADPHPAYDRVLRFLGVRRFGYPGFSRHNWRPRPNQLPDSLRRQLMDGFEEHDRRLVRWLGGEPSWRR